MVAFRKDPFSDKYQPVADYQSLDDALTALAMRVSKLEARSDVTFMPAEQYDKLWDSLYQEELKEVVVLSEEKNRELCEDNEGLRETIRQLLTSIDAKEKKNKQTPQLNKVENINQDLVKDIPASAELRDELNALKIAHETLQEQQRVMINEYDEDYGKILQELDDKDDELDKLRQENLKLIHEVVTLRDRLNGLSNFWNRKR